MNNAQWRDRTKFGTHVVECPVPEMEAVHPLHPEDAEANCICDALRACEQRVREDMALQYLVSDREQQEAEQRAYAAGLDAARDDLGTRIEREQSEGDCDGLLAGLYYARECLDALRGER